MTSGLTNERARHCRFCQQPLETLCANLGVSPLANSYLLPEQLAQPELFLPLRVFVCDACFLMQSEYVEAPANIFSEYAYLSTYSSTWLEHCRRYVEEMV